MIPLIKLGSAVPKFKHPYWSFPPSKTHLCESMPFNQNAVMPLTMHYTGPLVLNPAGIRFGYTLLGSPVILCRNSAAFIHIFIRNLPSCIRPYFCAQPSVYVWRIFKMIFPEQNDIVCRCFFQEPEFSGTAWTTTGNTVSLPVWSVQPWKK